MSIPRGSSGIPLLDWHVGVFSRHLYNLYVYFWRWAAWKVFDHHPSNNTGIVCYITVAGFLSGPGFQAMRAYMRRTCDHIWVVDCSPEGYQPSVATRVFQGVQQPICIVLAARSAQSTPDQSAAVWFRSLPEGPRQDKFEALASISLADETWIACPGELRGPFLPASSGAWVDYPTLSDFFVYNGSGVMPGRTWVIAPDANSLKKRWGTLLAANPASKEALFHPHLRNGKPGDKHSKKVVTSGLAGFPHSMKSISDETSACPHPTRYAFRSFDRQWIIPDARLINQANPELWNAHSIHQIFMTAFTAKSPTTGPALSITGLIPDLDHYKGSFGGRVFPLWLDVLGTKPNIRPTLLALLSSKLGVSVSANDAFAYIAAIACHPGYGSRFRGDLATPGVRIPLTACTETFLAAVEIGKKIVWLHTFGERMSDVTQGRPPGPPRLPAVRRPSVSKIGTISEDPSAMPDTISYEATKKQLWVGNGFVDGVEADVWNYDVSGKQVLVQWFSYRKKNRDRPIMGDRRPPSPLSKIQPDAWLAEYTTELLNVLNVLGLLVELEAAQETLLERICSGPQITVGDMSAAGVYVVAPKLKQSKATVPGQPDLFANVPAKPKA